MTNERNNQPKNLQKQLKISETLELGEKEKTFIEVIDISPKDPISDTPVFLAMGWGGNKEVYRKNLYAFGKRSRVLSYKNIHGIDVESDGFAERRKATTILEVLKNKGIDKADAVGYSEGGMNILLSAFMNPERFRNIVLVNPAGLIEKDNELKLTARFLKDFFLHLYDTTTLSSGNKRKVAIEKWKNFYGGMIESIKEDHKKSISEITDMSHFNIRDIMKYLRKEHGIKISLIVNKKDSAFPPDSFRDTLEGCYDDFQELEEGRHGDFVLNAKPMTKVVIEKLDKMQADKNPPK